MFDHMPSGAGKRLLSCFVVALSVMGCSSLEMSTPAFAASGEASLFEDRVVTLTFDFAACQKQLGRLGGERLSDEKMEKMFCEESPEKLRREPRLLAELAERGEKNPCVQVSPYVAEIYYNRRDDRRPNQVRWVIECPEVSRRGAKRRCLEPDDVLIIRPRSGESKTLFSPETGGVFKLSGEDVNSFVSGLPNDPEFELPPLHGGKRGALWFYTIEVIRDGKTIAYLDPPVWVEDEGGTDEGP